MMVGEDLLRCLADSEFHSGEALGEKLGITRAAVWKQIKVLKALGLQLDTVRGRGYRLPLGGELLQCEAILSSLVNEARQALDVNVALQADSTNDWVRRLPLQQSKSTVCLAEYQTNGRGRRGRVWQNPLGATISMSLRWQVSAGMASLEGLSLVVGLAVLQGLQACGAEDLKLKWPNDILWQSKTGLHKLSGILLELYGDPNDQCEIIIGIGINVALSQQQLDDIDQPVIDMQRICGYPVSRNKLVAFVLNHLMDTLHQFEQYGFDLFRDQWQRYDALQNLAVEVNTGREVVQGIARGINEQGGLVVETMQGMTTFHGGDVSVRKSLS